MTARGADYRIERYNKYVLNDPGFNSMPEPYEEISEQRFWHHVLIWGFGEAHDYRQIIPDKNPDIFEGITGRDRYTRPIHIIIGHEYAIGVMEVVEKAIPKPWKFFRIGCKHEKATGTDTMYGDHTRNCPTCGLHWSWDSSG